MVSQRLLITSMGVCLSIFCAVNAMNEERSCRRIYENGVYIAMNGALEISGIITNGSATAAAVTEILQKFDTNQHSIVQEKVSEWKPWMLWQYYVQFHRCEFSNTSDLGLIVAAFPEREALSSDRRRSVIMSDCTGSSMFAMVQAFLRAGIDVELYGSNISAEANTLFNCNIPEGTVLTFRSANIHITGEQYSRELRKRIEDRFLQLGDEGKLEVKGGLFFDR